MGSNRAETCCGRSPRPGRFDFGGLIVSNENGTPLKDIRDLNLEELRAELERAGEPPYRAAQIFGWLYKKGAASFVAMTDLPGGLRDKLARTFVMAAPDLDGVFESKDGSRKYMFRLGDGHCVETVSIPSGVRKTICVSTQVGCKFGCAFCASGLGGFVRNLVPSEVVGQVLFLRDVLDVTLTNIVFMGMGEPLDNFENLARAIQILNAPEGLGIAARRMTVSTAGFVPGIDHLRKLGLQVNLSISLHASTDAKRDELMPINRKYPLEALMRACEEYLRGGGRKITLEYVLLGGFNDSPEDADGLARVASRLRAKVNLILYSPVSGLPFTVPEAKRVRDFLGRLTPRGVPAMLRRSKGIDIQAACGQLSGRLSRRSKF